MWNLFKNNKNYQAIKVRYQVEKMQKKAEKMGLPKLISDLYHHNIMHYPSWISHSRKYVPAIVEKAVKQDDNYKEEKVEIILNNKIYLFGYKKVTMADDYGELELYMI